MASQLAPKPRTRIDYDPAGKDFRCLVDGREIGRARSYLEGEAVIADYLNAQARIPPGPAEKLVVTVKEAAAMLSISRSQCYALIQRGELPALRVGAHWRVATAALTAWVERQAQPVAAPDPTILATRPYNRRKA